MSKETYYSVKRDLLQFHLELDECIILRMELEEYIILLIP
jgi:hypothetical protein